MLEEKIESHASKLGRPKKLESDPIDAPKHIDKTAEYKKQRDNEVIRGRFNYLSKPGATLHFNAYLDAGDSEKKISITDGEIFPLKRKIAKHLNETGQIKVHKNVKNAAGCDEVVLSHVVKRWFYENYDFFELDEMPV